MDRRPAKTGALPGYSPGLAVERQVSGADVGKATVKRRDDQPVVDVDAELVAAAPTGGVAVQPAPRSGAGLRCCASRHSDVDESPDPDPRPCRRGSPTSARSGPLRGPGLLTPVSTGHLGLGREAWGYPQAGLCRTTTRGSRSSPARRVGVDRCAATDWVRPLRLRRGTSRGTTGARYGLGTNVVDAAFYHASGEGETWAATTLS
jgi:hypothetical protein